MTPTSRTMKMNMYEFFADLKSKLSTLIVNNRYVLADSAGSLGYEGRGRGSASVTFINLPYARVKERRGGGAESENNRQLFFVNGFNSGPFVSEGVEKVQIEQLVNNIGVPGGQWSEKLRKKTGSPDKIATYLANYLNEIASAHPPQFTHE
jgi:hypothetical protein